MSDNTNTKLAEELDNEIKDVAKKLFQDGATLGELKGITPRELNAVYQMGLGFYNTGRYDDAEKVFRFLVLFDHLNARYWTGLGAVFQVKKNYADAITAYGYASFLDLKNPKPQYLAAECFLALGDKTNALSAIAALEQFCPKETELGREYLAKATALKALAETNA
jgi:type III secretion system low calcium response chaperone LcrH/SycD